MANRFSELLSKLQEGLYEREEALNLSLLAALASESIFLLGKPGVAKSLIARRLKLAFQDSRAFEYLMSRFSTPDEIFGPVSISRLKDQDKYERIIDNYLPNADIAFLDEIWKAGSSIQNALLTMLNEKIYRNGDQEIHSPLKLLIAASNELPAEGEGLEALWDRFLIRYVVEPIQEDQNFIALLKGETNKKLEIPKELQIKASEFVRWSSQINYIFLSDTISTIILNLRKEILLYNEVQKKNIELSEEDNTSEIYISDRRWLKLIRLLKTSAFMHQRKKVNLLDLAIIPHCLWDKPEQRETIQKILDKVITPKTTDNNSASLYSKVKIFKEQSTQQAFIRQPIMVNRPKVIQGRFYELLIDKEQLENWARSSRVNSYAYYFSNLLSNTWLIDKNHFEALSVNASSPISLYNKNNLNTSFPFAISKLGENAIKLHATQHNNKYNGHTSLTFAIYLATEKVEEQQEIAIPPTPESIRAFSKIGENLKEEITKDIKGLKEELEESLSEKNEHLFCKTSPKWLNKLTHGIEKQISNLNNLLIDVDIAIKNHSELL